MVKQNLKLSKQIKPIRHHGTLSMTEYNLLKKKYELGKSAFGSVKIYQRQQIFPSTKLINFYKHKRRLQSTDNSGKSILV